MAVMLKVSLGGVNIIICTRHSMNTSIDVVLSVGQHIVSVKDAMGSPAGGRIDVASVNMLHHVKVRGDVLKLLLEQHIQEKGIAKGPTAHSL